MAKVVIVTVISLVGIYLSTDIFVNDIGEHSSLILMFRSSFILISVYMVIKIHHTKSAKSFYLLISIWLVIFFLNKLTVNSIISHKLNTNLMIDSIIILSIYIVVPLKKAQKTVFALLFTIADLIIVLINIEFIKINLFNIFFVFIASNIIGFLSYHSKFKYKYMYYNTNIENEVLLKQSKVQLEEIKQLTGLIPICASCKKVRDDAGYWNKVEHYFSDKIHVKFTHSVCPDCKNDMLNDLENHKHK